MVNLIESLCNFLLIRSDNHELLPHCLETLEHVHSVVRKSGFDLETDNLRDNHMDELFSRWWYESLL